MADEELVQLLVDGLVHVRLIDHDERVLGVHITLLELATEVDGDLVRHVAVELEEIRHRLLLERDLARAAEDVGALDDAALQHRADDVVVGAGLAGLDVRPEEGVAERTRGEYIDDVLAVAHLLLRDEGSECVDGGAHRRHLGRKKGRKKGRKEERKEGLITCAGM